MTEQRQLTGRGQERTAEIGRTDHRSAANDDWLMTGIRRSVGVLLLVLLVTGCAAGGPEYANTQAGFFSGVWHGWIAPIALIWHLFDNDVRIYEINNTGIWYDVGFYIAVISGFGSLGLSRKRKR